MRRCSSLRKRSKAASTTLLALGCVAMSGGSAAAGSTDCSAELVAEWQVRLVRDQPLIDGTVNGQSVAVKLDTGATHTLLFRSAAERLGLALQRTRARMFGIGGEADLEIALVHEFKIGATTRQGSRMLVASEHNRNEVAAVLLGYDFLRKFDVEFDLAHNAARLYQPKECNTALTAAWGTGRVNEAEIEPIDETRPQVVLSVRINGQPVQALLDSGAEVSILSKGDAAAVGVTPETPGVAIIGTIGGLGGKPVTTWIGPFRSIAIGNELIKDAALPFADLYRRNTYTPIGSLVPITVDERQLMLLGVDFLRAHRVLIANSQHKVYFAYVGGPVFQAANAFAPRDLRAEGLQSVRSWLDPAVPTTEARP